jgi:hypothetical protein
MRMKSERASIAGPFEFNISKMLIILQQLPQWQYLDDQQAQPVP